LEWQKNAGKPKSASQHEETSRFKFFWDRLSEDEKYLHTLTYNQAYRGRQKAKNLTEDELKAVKDKAAQLQYMWTRQQIKAEEKAAFTEKVQRKQEQKEKREEEERSLAEQHRVSGYQ
jgi:hypothetical protein